MPIVDDTQNLNAWVKDLRHLGRIEHFDSEGGGRITRVIYCEPYTAHKRVVTALRGTIYPAGAGTWARAYPHQDPLYPWFFCQDVQVEPAFPSAARSSTMMEFQEQHVPSQLGIGNEQFGEIQRALSTADDYDGADLIDNLTPAEVLHGKNNAQNLFNKQPLNTGGFAQINAFDSRGACGAKITATYLPLLFQPGLPSADNPFDFVDPQWTPITLTTQVGRSLFLIAPVNGAPRLCNGLSDTYALPEVVWRFSIRRLMVPFLPAKTLALFANKINQIPFVIGNLVCPSGTVRMETPEIITRRAPDGQLYFDIVLKFLVRRLYDEYYDPEDNSYKPGWITWNHAYAIPHGRGVLGGIQLGRACYHPVTWNAGFFQVFGVAHPLFLYDSQIPGGQLPAGIIGAMRSGPFTCGFDPGQ
jgi:hypothetical protein